MFDYSDELDRMALGPVAAVIYQMTEVAQGNGSRRPSCSQWMGIS